MDKTELIEIFNDTQRFYETNEKLENAIQASKKATKLYEADEYPVIDRSDIINGHVKGSGVKEAGDASTHTAALTKHRTFEAAMKIHAVHPDWKIAVLNFASATNPGGGVTKGSKAQEESLCRCSTLYPVLTQDWLWRAYYKKNRDAHDNLHTDDCIYSPNIVICKTDEDSPARMKEADWVFVDVISCAAPNLRPKPNNAYNADSGKPVVISREELYRLHVQRAKHIMHVAAGNDADALVLGAFGCGAFMNDPEVVARAYREVLKEYGQYFKLVEFAVYCKGHETVNYDAFRRVLTGQR